MVKGRVRHCWLLHVRRDSPGDLKIWQCLISKGPLHPPPWRAGLQAAVLAAGDPQWEVRNAANLAFAAMAVRLLGYKNLMPVRLCPTQM